MADKKECINWFLTQIPILTEKGIMTPEQASTLEEHYKAEFNAIPPGRNLYSMILGTIGIIMATAGVILFLNYNWDMFPKAVRILLAALPLLFGAALSYTTLLGSKNQLWREASAVFTSAGGGTLIAVLSQIYHTGGELHEFMFLILILSLPLIYIFDSIVLTSLYLFFSFFLNSFLAPAWWNPLILLLIQPYLFFHLRNTSSRQVWCRYLALLAGISLFISCGTKDYYAILMPIILCSLFLTAGSDLYLENKSAHNPWIIFPFAIQTIILAVGSSQERIFFRCSLGSKDAAFWITMAVNLALIALYLFIFFRKRITLERSLNLILILLTSLPLIMQEAWFMRVLYNIFFGLTGILYIRYGLKQKSQLFFNGGAIMLCVLTACRFFDSDIGVLFRSGGLTVLGIGFLLANRFFVKFSNKKEAAE